MNHENRITNSGHDGLRQSFHEWDGGNPSPELWDDLEAELSVHAIWSGLSEVLENDHNLSDNTILDAYENWSPNQTADGWSKLDEQLSRERVWTKLSQTLSFPIRTTVPWLKMAAASLLFISLAFYTDFVTPDYQRPEMGSSNLPVNQLYVDASNESKENNSLELIARNQLEKQVANQPTNATEKQQLTDVNLIENSQKFFDKYEISDEVAISNAKTTAKSYDLAFEQIPNLASKSANFDVSQIDLGDFTLIPREKIDFRPRFSAQVGGQFSFINENRREQFTSSLPSMGIAANFQYHFYSKFFRYTQDFGFSQYVQTNGNYINGKFLSTYQRLNTIYLSSAVGFRMNNLTVFGGVSANYMINGYESNSRYITNVYSSNRVQLGAIAGLDYHFSPFKNKTAMGVSAQYQFVSKLKSGNTQFNDIQGVKLQIKYSF